MRRWIPKLSKQRRRRLAKPLTGIALAITVVAVVWWAADRRLQLAARELAADGRSPAVADLRSDWVAAVAPAALTAPGRPGQAARRTANARFDLAIGRAARGDSETLYALARRTLTAIEQSPGAPTADGADWAKWLAARIVQSSDSLEPAERLELLTLAERSLASLKRRPRRRPQPAAPEPPPEPPAEPIYLVEEPPPAWAMVPPPDPPTAAQPREPLVAQTAPRMPTSVAPAPEPLPWETPSEEEPTQPAPTEPAPFPNAREDRDLLASWLGMVQDLARTRGRSATAAGPTSAPSGHHDPAAALRPQLAQVEAELAGRGFASLQQDQVATLLSPDERNRRLLVDQLLTQRSTEAAPLLLVLAKDRAGSVREAAISALGSSQNRALVQAALEMAIRDRDPRVGRLAEALRARLR